MGLLSWIIVGAVAGMLAGLVMQGRGFGFLGDIVVGIIGACIGGGVGRLELSCARPHERHQPLQHSDRVFGRHRFHHPNSNRSSHRSKKMSNTVDYILGKWHELRGQCRQQWGRITADDLTRLSGRIEELTGVLQQRYGFGKAQAKTEVDLWVYDLNRQEQNGWDYEVPFADESLTFEVTAGEEEIEKYSYQRN